MLPTVKVVAHKGTGPDSFVIVEATIKGWDVQRALDAVSAQGGPGSYVLVSLTNVDVI